jgi:hypothetical protein
MPHRIFPHDPPERLTEGVWRVRGGLSFPLYRNMIIVRLASGDLVIHSAVAMDDAGMKALEALGRPAYLIVPNRGHVMDAAFYKQRYPGMMVLTLAAIRDAVAAKTPVDATVEDILPALGFRLHAVPATRAEEYHRGGDAVPRRARQSAEPSADHGVAWRAGDRGSGREAEGAGAGLTLTRETRLKFALIARHRPMFPRVSNERECERR